MKSSLLSSHSLDTNLISNRDSQPGTQISNHTVIPTPHVSISHVAKACSSLFYLNIGHRVQSRSICTQKAVLCVLVMLEQHPHLRQSHNSKQRRAIGHMDSPSRSPAFNDFTPMPVIVADVYERYTSLCHLSQAVAALPYTDFLDVVSVLETHWACGNAAWTLPANVSARSLLGLARVLLPPAVVGPIPARPLLARTP